LRRSLQSLPTTSSRRAATGTGSTSIRDRRQGEPAVRRARWNAQRYIITTGEAALKKGGPYPNKSMFVTDLHDFMITDGSYVEGARKGLAVMVKDAKKYASTAAGAFSSSRVATPRSRR
jgi:hypothetical protein